MSGGHSADNGGRAGTVGVGAGDGSGDGSEGEGEVVGIEGIPGRAQKS